MGKKKIKNSFEDDLTRLEEISSLLEGDEIGLEEAIKLYDEGVKLSKACLSVLNKAEVKITELKKEINNKAGTK